MPFKAVTFDAYGTLVHNRGLSDVARRMVADHGLAAAIDDVTRCWVDLYYEATQQSPFRTLRAIQADILPRVLKRFDASGDAACYVDLFFETTTRIELYPEVPGVLNALGHVRSAIISNADREHLAAWPIAWPVEFILISEDVQAYKPHRRLFERALERFGVEPHAVLHVGDSDVDDVKGAKDAGMRVAWINRDGRPLRPGVPRPDFEMSDLSGLLTIV